ncbi:hypothetical protein C8R46DRAFT_1047594 [Mycena filopes]|nr:hypothetical protein C8R46DRAFT_1047594 [Mycena filopes]
MLSALGDFMHEVFEELVMSPDDAVVDAALAKYFASNFEDINVATGVALNHDACYKLAHDIRAQFTHRKLVSDKFIIATPADPTHRTGAGAVIHVFTALERGKGVKVTIVSVVRIEWVPKHGHEHGGQRQLVTESLIMNTEPYVAG